MKLYFKPGACSLASRIVLTETDQHFEAEAVDTSLGLTAAGADFGAINPKGYVPALELEPGVVLTENVAILQHLADRVPEAALAPPAGGLDRVRLQEWLAFTASELHKAFHPWFRGSPLSEAELEAAATLLSRRIGEVERGFADGRPFILGERFSVADAYLFVVLRWSGHISVDLGPWPAVAAFVARVGARPSVRAAMAAEGLAQPAVAA